jgi:sulfoxide reductase heme-binding subunit YedZ
VAAAAGVVHFWWLVKSDIREPLLYGAILTLLLAYRAVPASLRLPARPQSRSPVGHGSGKA